MRFFAHARTDTGKQRQNNEDRYFCDPEKGLFIVADGMGGGIQGEEAAALAVDVVVKVLEEGSPLIEVFRAMPFPEAREKVTDLLFYAIQKANQRVGAEVPKKGSVYPQMGTTLTVFLAVGHTGFLAHVGDSRFYLVRKGEVTQLSTDHTVGAEMKVKFGGEPGPIDSSIAGALSRAVGIADSIDPEIRVFDLFPDDRYLLMTDGVYRYFSIARLPEVMSAVTGNLPSGDAIESSLETITGSFVDFAYSHGAQDNITVILVLAITGKEDAEPRSLLHEKIDMIRSLPLFKTFTYEELLKFFEKTEIRAGSKYDVLPIGRQHEPELFIVIDGLVSILKNNATVARYSTGDCIGTYTFFTERKPEVSYFIEKSASFIVLSKTAFMSLIHEAPLIAVKLLWEFNAVSSGKLASSIFEKAEC